MMTPTEFYKWWIDDERTGKRCRTTYMLSRADAERAFPAAEPDLRTLEVRDLSNVREGPPDSRPRGNP